jgi:hypothetical protein
VPGQHCERSYGASPDRAGEARVTGD